MEAKERFKIISACYKILENDVWLSDTDELSDAWIKARRAVDVAIFKAGYEERDKWLSPNETDRLEEAMMAGRKEVVEWGNEDCPHLWIDDNGVPVTHPKHECSQCWQSKEWGIKNGH